MQKLQKRKNEIYGNWLVLSIQGNEMFRCVSKKARWYLDRDLATLVSTDPNVIQLTFEAKGEGWMNDPYYLGQKENRCVVCGTTDQEVLTRHHIVPYIYRREMPLELKGNSSFDIVPICIEDHVRYEESAENLKRELCLKHGVPPYGKVTPLQKKMRTLGGLAYALKHRGSLIPPEKTQQMWDRLVSELGTEDLNEMLHLTKKGQRKGSRESEKLHAQQLMEKINNMQEFFEIWRLHFLENARPQFMPEGWDPHRPVDTVRI